MPRRSKRAGFTLIELLVVVAIVALLVAILVPTLYRAREHARTTACLANLRAIMLAESLYQTEWYGAITVSDYRGPHYAWTTILVGLGYVTAPLKLKSTDPLELSGRSILMCPSGMTDRLAGATVSYSDPEGARGWQENEMWTKELPPAGATPYGVVNCWYMINASSGGYGNAGAWFPVWRVAGDNDTNNWSAIPKAQFFRVPGLTVAFGDGCLSINPYNGYRMNARHNDFTAINLAFWDGHAETAPERAIPLPGFGTYWSVSALNALGTGYNWRMDQTP